ncbi:MAG: hypothetical protein VX730_06345 [Pseudomonadota bacterium]|nr:hypothetical protein [Pseudomonadota bacterium]
MNENNDKQHKSLGKVYGEHMAYKLILSAILGIALHGSLFAQTCISYTAEGISGCMDNDAYAEEEEVVEATPLPQVPQQQQQVMQPALTQPMKTEMDLKVEEFYNTYDKPPREFAEWTVNPTVENALRWARKYDEMMTRNQKMAEAWQAAQKIYKQTKDQGGELPELSKPLPPIPEYPGLMPPPGSKPPSMAQKKENPYNRTSDAISFARENVSASGSLTPIDAYGGKSNTAAPQGPIEVSYYFSNVCPFCKKFEPELRLAMDRISSSDVKLTCVDTSPKEQKRENIAGIIDCDWRPLLPGELEAFGVRSTPTLLISTGPKAPLIKREGVLVATEIEMLLKNLAKSRSKS